MKAVECSSLKKVYGNVVAVDGISFDVEEGEVFGLLGPNGAGKTTVINVLTTLIRPTSGVARVCGYDVLTQQGSVRRVIGLVPQDLTVDDELTGMENLRLQAALYHMPKDLARKRIEEVLEQIDLNEAIHRKVSTYSGGMRKRLELAGALIHRPKVLFLDEPTLGLDVQTRTSIWTYVKRLAREEGVTVFMTTHYMDEADANCDRVAIIDRGQIKAIDSPRALKSRFGYDAIELEVVQNGIDLKELLSNVSGLKGIESYNSRVLIKAEGGEEVLPEVLGRLISSGVTVNRVEMRKPTLDEVFMSLTGRRIRDEHSSKEEVLKQRFNIRRLRA
ncbi:MAG: ATP-binding cassette domain-containing protein [Thaumarchaeota archaeon]|nr:ATP-binding cassette domain-containing protein [Candidatus Calditenuaceae archaeon]MDW8041970.1 ATP-binding cassette domain-containing protein [Nitrososphaerota archaeon]